VARRCRGTSRARGQGGRSSGRIQAPVWNTAPSAGSGQGASVGSAASQGRSVNMWPRTSSTGARPREARCELSAAPNVLFTRSASRAQSSRVVRRRGRRHLSRYGQWGWRVVGEGRTTGQ
jgi:hypothetical protein